MGIADVCLDDSHKNCVGAKDVGWNVVHFVEEGYPAPDTPASQYQIRSLEELRSIFAGFFKVVN
jgi:pyrimidine and pyridine-specific 5'-nucleotidase